MSQLKEVKEKLSFVFGKKPIVYFVTEDIDFIDMIFEESPNFCIKDANEDGEYVELDKREYVKKNYNSSKSDFWRSLVNDEGGLEALPKFIGNPTYCYIKNFNYLLGINHNAKEGQLYHLLLSYVTGYGMLSKEARAKNILVLSGTAFAVPDGIAPYVEVIDVPYPDEEDALRLCERCGVITAESATAVRDFWAREVTKMKGFTNMQIEDVLKMISARFPRMAVMDGAMLERQMPRIRQSVEELVNEQKLQTVKKNGILQFIDYPPEVKAAGCRNVEEFIERRREVFLNPKAFPGVNPPKGILYAGVPGTGKSLMAQKLASLLGVPLLKLDMGSLMNSLMGESEGRLRRALKMAESVAPCVLFIDELDKAFSTDDTSHEVSKRMFGYMLGWMQDCKQPVFIYATANHLERIDGAFLRSGRFDSKFFAFMPNCDQCTDIFIGCLEKRKKAFTKSGLSLFAEELPKRQLRVKIANALGEAAEVGKFLNGADIECWVNMAISALYYQNKKPPFALDDFFKALRSELQSLSAYGKSNVKEIASYWLQNRFGSIELSDDPLFEFSDFDPEAKNPENVKDKNEKSASYFVPRDESDFNNVKYDYLLYRTIVEAIDKISYVELRHKYMGI